MAKCPLVRWRPKLPREMKRASRSWLCAVFALALCAFDEIHRRWMSSNPQSSHERLIDLHIHLDSAHSERLDFANLTGTWKEHFFGDFVSATTGQEWLRCQELLCPQFGHTVKVKFRVDPNFESFLVWSDGPMLTNWTEPRRSCGGRITAHRSPRCGDLKAFIY